MAGNERLRAAMAQAGIGAERLAHAAEVDPKTVYRWLAQARPPKKPEIRRLVANLLRHDPDWLWPTTRREPAAPTDAEIVATYTYRSDLPTERWWHLITQSRSQIDLLGYTLYFLALQHAELVDTLRSRCEAGCRIRAVIGDPESPHVAYRDTEEGTPLTLVVRINTTLTMLRELFGCPGFQLRFQDIPLYNSIFRFDDQMLVTPHLFATTGAKAPLMHLRRVGQGGLFGQFAGHFDSVWQHAKPDPNLRQRAEEGV